MNPNVMEISMKDIYVLRNKDCHSANATYNFRLLGQQKNFLSHYIKVVDGEHVAPIFVA